MHSGSCKYVNLNRTAEDISSDQIQSAEQITGEMASKLFDAWGQTSPLHSEFIAGTQHFLLNIAVACRCEIQKPAFENPSNGTLDDAKSLKLPGRYINYYSVYSSIISDLLHFNSR